jgi:hypothetical protein
MHDLEELMELVKLPAHTYLDERGIPYEARSFPTETEES